MSRPELTGRFRYRPTRHWGRTLLVLQVEERRLVTSFTAGLVDSEWVIGFRDATVEDVTAGKGEDNALDPQGRQQQDEEGKKPEG